MVETPPPSSDELPLDELVLPELAPDDAPLLVVPDEVPEEVPLLDVLGEPEDDEVVPPLDAPVDPLLPPLSFVSVVSTNPPGVELAPLHPAAMAPLRAHIPMRVAIFIVSSFSHGLASVRRIQGFE